MLVGFLFLVYSHDRDFYYIVVGINHCYMIRLAN